MTYTYRTFKHETTLKIQWIMSEFGWSQSVKLRVFKMLKLGTMRKKKKGCWGVLLAGLA